MIKRLWVQILLGAGLFFYCIISLYIYLSIVTVFDPSRRQNSTDFAIKKMLGCAAMSQPGLKCTSLIRKDRFDTFQNLFTKESNYKLRLTLIKSGLDI